MLVLKNYQQKVLNDLQTYLQILNNNVNADGTLNKNLSEIYDLYLQYLQQQGKDLTNATKYKINEVLGDKVANVCVKIPTAGGKTFIAVNAIKSIFDNAKKYVNVSEKMVVWLVPSQAIYEQTLKNLSNNKHPYKQKLNADFDNNVIVINKEDALFGKNFSANLVENNLTILIITYDSLKGGKATKETLKTYAENGNLISFKDKYKQLEAINLISVLQTLNPIVIIDESHNAKTDLSFDMLKELNPSFILELTATPKAESNIISEVYSVELKAEQMVKLPIMVTNLANKNDVFSAAKNMQETLEKIAKENEEITGNYIRPIVLFQAEADIKNKKNKKNKVNKSNELNNDNENQENQNENTYLKIKQHLVEKLAIKESWIKIKTAEINELKGIDLLSKNCPVRYIITINALKEGWDCPFAYILATLANKKSEIDVTQIIGRILRQPYAQNQNKYELNTSYIFTSTDKFQNTLEKIVKSLNGIGYEKEDCIKTEFSNKTDNNNDNQYVLKSILENVEKQNKEYENSMNNKLKEISKTNKDFVKVKVKDKFINDIENIKLPQFFLKVKVYDLFHSNSNEFTEIELNYKNLLKDFDLSKKDIEIDFEEVLGNIYRVDFEDESDLFDAKSVSEQQNKKMLELFAESSNKTQIKQLLKLILKELKGDIFDAIKENILQKYIEKIIENFNNEQRKHCYKYLDSYINKIKIKIKNLAYKEAKKIFSDYIVTSKIYMKANYVLKDSIEIKTAKKISRSGSLYKEEENFTNNTLETKFIEVLQQKQDSLKIKWWHKNISKKGFCINGFLNHYPDFVIYTENKNLILIETKGSHLEGNEDTILKAELGEIWQNQSNNLENKNDAYGVNKYYYFMVFENAPTIIKNNVAKSINEVIKLLKDL